jgi:small subunit ribosomal protein S1
MLPFTPENAAEFGGNVPAGGQRGGFPGAAGAGGAGARRGRRGRRSEGIDYDYSYVAADAGSKSTTKLGDVYADLFAQFGLGDTKAEDAAEEPAKAEATEAKAEPKAEAAPVAEEASAAAEAPKEEAPKAEAPKAEEKAEAAPVDPENAIDAAEAAALLTAAFREGKRPAGAAEEAYEAVEATEEAAEEEVAADLGDDEDELG